MDPILIKFELCAEDRARLDRIAEGLENLKPSPLAGEAADVMAQLANTIKVAEGSADTAPAPELPDPADTAAPFAAVLVVTQELVRQKAIELSAANGGKLKARVRAVVNTYSPSITELPEAALSEVWARLVALEKEVDKNGDVNN